MRRLKPNAMSRRQLMLGAGIGAGALLSSPLHAKMPFAKAQAPGFFRRKLGAFEVTAVLDGDVALELKLYSGDAAEIAKLSAQSYQPSPPRSHVNAFAVNTGDRLYLVDTGTGVLMGSSLGRVAENLVLSGINPDQVDAILLTHLHPDHFGGLTMEGRPIFKNADVYVAEADAKFWLSTDAADKAPPDFRPFFQMAVAAIKPYAHRLKPIPANGEIGPGVSALSLPGHTVGHSGFLFASEKQQMLVWGDIIHNAALQFARPEWTLAFDSDQAQAAAARKRAFDMAATERLLVAGMHLPFPGLGFVERTGAAYRYHPDFWSTKL
ncbi:MAG TPA: MBL fold metallo-hydrolase [Xanthobacteraceae bacterium]|nr:MBL fold metallo-hydrolase [Xanthobacteraceae bacterium]